MLHAEIVLYWTACHRKRVQYASASVSLRAAAEASAMEISAAQISVVSSGHLSGQYLLLCTAGWIVYTSGKSWDGKTHPVLDPLASQLAKVHRVSGDDVALLVDNTLAIEQVFGSDLKGNNELKSKRINFVAALKARPIIDILPDFLAGPVQTAA
jgi:hypothetical protein